MNTKFLLQDDELKNAVGGYRESGIEFPVGTKLIQNEYNEEIGRYSGYVSAVYHGDDGTVSYDVCWSNERGDTYVQRNCSQYQVERWYMCWDLEFN